VLEIKHLLYEKRYTIEGARAFLQQRRGANRASLQPPPAPATQSSLFGPDPGQAQAKLAPVKAELQAILELLSK
jgi:hypothetical protein